MFNSRINHNLLNENIFNEDIYVDADNRYKLVFTVKSLSGIVYKYVFHIFIKCDHHDMNLKFIIDYKDFTYNYLYVNKLKYLKIEQKFIFNKIENFKIYLKTDKPLTIMKYSSYEVLIKYHPASILNNQDRIKELIYRTNKLDEDLNEKVDENNRLIRELILKDIEKIYMDELTERIENNFININNKFHILDKKLNNYHVKFHKINEMIDLIFSDEYTKIYRTYYPIKNYDLAQY